MADLKAVLAWSALAAGAAVVAERGLSRVLGDPNGSMLDWELVRRTAYARAGEDGAHLVAAVGAEYDPLVAELVPLLAQACGTGAQSANFGRVRVVGRRGFIDQNLAMMRRLIQPLEGNARLVRPSPVMRIPTSLYLGTLLGFMARRVLGQYDPVLAFEDAHDEDLPTPALLIIEPNVREFERNSELPIASLRRWLMLHELTHAWQFELHPWLIPHLTGMVKELSTLPRAGSGKGVDEFVAAARQLRPQLATVGRVQAVMAVIEGHANYIMREVGRTHLPDFDTLDQAFHRRHDSPNPLERLLLLVSGVALKMQQYQQGERFLRRVEEVGGADALARVWSGPESMPGWSEVRHADNWLRRMGYLPSPFGEAAPSPA